MKQGSGSHYENIILKIKKKFQFIQSIFPQVVTNTEIQRT